jgi:hypothetical protein
MTRAPGRLAELDPGGAQAAGGGVDDQRLAGLEATPTEEGQVGSLEGQEEGGGLGVVEAGGASKTEMASAMAYSAMPPRAFLVMATTRLPSHDSAPSPGGVDHAADVHAQVNGGGWGPRPASPGSGRCR